MSKNDPWTGFRCSHYCAGEFLNLLRDPGRDIGRLEFLRAVLTIPNIAMLLAPGLALLAPPHRRLWPAILATLFAAQAAYFCISNKIEDLRAFRIGYWVWVTSFVILAASLWLWEARVRHAGQSSPPTG